MTGEALLRARGLAAGYGGKMVIKGIDLDVLEGEIFGLIGLNGAGKTTFIKAVLGLGEGEGEITLFGQDGRLSESRGDLAYLPEKFMPSPLLKGWEFLDITLAYYNIKLDRTLAADLSRGLDLDPAVLERSGRTYSKGMGQKLGLLATLLSGRKLLILDEPMSGLDPRSRIMLKDRLIEHRGQGRSVFFSSHIMADIEEICDRIGVMHQGRLIFTGQPAAFVSRWGASTLERALLAAVSTAEEGAGPIRA
jgi:ABC-2 type transport system ATP-binding protein